MDKAYSIFIIVLVFFLLFAFLPRLAELFGFGGLATSGLDSSLREENNSTSGSLISVSYDGGKNFKEGILKEGVSRVEINDFEIIKKDEKTLFLAASNKGLLMSYDEGMTWYFFDDLKNILTKTNVSDLLVSPLNSGEVFMVIYKKDQSSVYKTTDNFITLEKLFDDQDKINSINIMSSNLNLIYEDRKVIQYDISTRQFRRLSLQIDNFSIDDYIYDKFKNFYGEKRKDDINKVYKDDLGRFFVGVGNKLYISGDYGFRWEVIETKVKGEISSIKVFEGGRIVLIGTKS